MRVQVDRERCCGSGMCVMSVPEVFDLDDGITVILLTPEPAAELHGVVRGAAEACPCAAIEVDLP